jgi:cytochrome c-type biogenesis protein CcmH
MTTFWILAAGLAGLAVLFVIAPLLQPEPSRPAETDDADGDQARLNLELFKQQLAELDADLADGKLDQTVYEAARRDLERELLYDLGDRDPLTAVAADARMTASRLPGPRLTALALLLVIPLAGWGLYALIGNAPIITQLEGVAATGSGNSHGGNRDLPPLEELVARLEQRLEQQPDDAEGWMMLGRTYFATGDRKGAQEALSQAYALSPNDPMIVLAYAEAIATNQDNQLEGRPAELISEALALDPQNATARWLAAMVAFQRGQFRSAATTWKGLLEGMDPSTEEAEELRALITEAEQRAGVPAPKRQDESAAAPAADAASAAEPSPRQAPEPDTPAPNPSATPAQSTPAAAETGPDAAPHTTTEADQALPGIRVRAELDPALAGRYPPATSVFIFARAASGPPMPLAVQRTTLAELPSTLRLDDSMAMMPAMRLSNFPQIIIGARVSPSGQAMPRPGDLEGETGPIASDRQAPVNVLIDRVRR